MKFNLRIVYILIISISGLFAVLPTLDAEVKNGDWSSSYDYFRRHFKSLSPSEEVYCERLLKEILNDLDTKNQCNGEGDCVLIKQEPFGNTVPFPRRLSEEMRTKMKDYCEHCDDGSFHSLENKDLSS